MTPKGHGFIRGRRDLIYDLNLIFDLGLVYDPTCQGVIRGRCDLLYDPKVNLTFDLDLDLKVKHLTWQLTTDDQITL